MINNITGAQHRNNFIYHDNLIPNGEAVITIEFKNNLYYGSTYAIVLDRLDFEKNELDELETNDGLINRNSNNYREFIVNDNP